MLFECESNNLSKYKGRINLYLIHGKAGSGKDYVADIITKIIKRDSEVIKMSLANYIKWHGEKYFGIDSNNKCKETRKFWTDYGTDYIRNTLCKDFHIDRLIDDIVVVSGYKLREYNKISIIVPDVRFTDELLSLIHFAFYNSIETKSIYVYGDYGDKVVAEHEELRGHESEQGINEKWFTYKIENTKNKPEIELVKDIYKMIKD